MAFQSAPNSASAFVQCSQGGETIGMAMNFFKGTGYDIDDIENLAAAVDEWMGTEYLPLAQPNLSYIQTNVRGLTNEVDLFAVANTYAGVGAASGGASPNNATFCIKKTTGFTGRAARGRVYIVGMPDSALSGGSGNLMLSTKADEFVDAFTALVDYTLPVGWTDIVLSRQLGGAPRLLGVPYVIEAYSYTDLTTDSQRRRLPNH